MMTHLHKRAHHEHARAHGFGTVENIGRHNRAVFGKGIGKETDIAFVCGRILRPHRRQALNLISGELEYEVCWKSFGVTFDLLVYRLVVTP